MLKAGALYFAIVVALLIAIITSSLIMLTAHYRTSYLKEIRYSRTLNNLNSGIAYLLNATERIEKENFDLFGDQKDSVFIERKNWGAFDLGTVKSHILLDTLSTSFLIGVSTTEDGKVIYLSDEDRPLSVAGSTELIGDGSLPRSGVKKSYVENKPYIGSDKLISGKISPSNQLMQGMQGLEEIRLMLNKDIGGLPLLTAEILDVSFKKPTLILKVLPGVKVDAQLTGNIILVSDSAITISASAEFENIQVYASSVHIESGFYGKCQIFARDSIIVGDEVNFSYPSVIGVVRTKESGDQPKITFGKNLEYNGIIFSYEDRRSPMQTFISFGKGCRISGEVYATGMLKFEKNFFVAGKVSCNRFIMQTSSAMYENFLIDVIFNRKARSKYYLTSKLFKGQTGSKEILTWVK